MASKSSRPLLLPHNRRLRHLKGISLRNLTLTHPRGYTIDDAALNKTPEKLEALREPELHHSQSTDSLKAKKRPGKARRRSTIWAGQSPGYRQKKLEDVIYGGMADSFFSLHCEGQSDPIYVSEVVKKAMVAMMQPVEVMETKAQQNPSFRFFDLTNYGASIGRLSTISIRIWVRRQEFSLLVEQQLSLRSLQFIGTLENRLLPPNCIIFHLIDGMYALDVPSDIKPPKPAHSLPTSSYSALMRLASLDDSIQDALANRESLAAQINTILHEKPVNGAPQAQDEAALTMRYLAAERKHLKRSSKKRSELKASLHARKEAIEQGMKAQVDAQDDVSGALEKLKQCRGLVKTTTENIHGQRRRICEELLLIFPIEPTSQPLLFTIIGLPLPNTSFEESDEDVLAAALGHVARLVDALQYYLSVPLPYPITPYGSRSIIRDQISILADSQRSFPLYTKGTVRYRFDYAVFLLNKNIERLAESQGLKVIDIRHILPNLKYLLYVCSAGSSELPSRKAGGIRGLLSGRATPIPSRRGSEDTGHLDAARKALENTGSGNGNGALKNTLATILPIGMDQGSTLRTRGLRENVVR